MTRYPELRLKLENVTQEDIFCIDLVHYTDKNDFEFKFENSTSWIERGLLQFFDGNEQVHCIEVFMINPRERIPTIHQIKTNQPFIYKIQGSLIENGDKVMLKLRDISYLFEKNKKYTIKFRCSDIRNINELIIIFK